MYRSTWLWVRSEHASVPVERERLRTDGGREDEREEGDEANNDRGSQGHDRPRAAEEGVDDEDAGDEQDGDVPAVDRAGVDVTEAGAAEPADPKWEKPAIDDLPKFELRADEPVASGGATESTDSTASMPNTAKEPGTRIKEEGTEGYVVALELCARLPDDVRLPEGAADLVPVAVEAEIEQDVQAFAAAEFDNPSPSVDTLSFVERDDEVWFRLRLGVSPETFADLDPEAIRTHALQQLEGMF